jgi:hypothetical protein
VSNPYLMVKSYHANNSHFEDESCYSEIMAYSLDLLLCTNLVPPAVGSYLPSEIFPEFVRDSFLQCAAPPYSASIQTRWEGVEQHLWWKLHAAFIDNTNEFENFAEYVIFSYVANCAKSQHTHYNIGNRLVMIDNDRCFMPEDAFSRPGIPEAHFARLAQISDLIFNSSCKILRSAERLLFRIAALHARGGLSAAFREVAKRDDLSDQILKDPRRLQEMDNRVNQLFSHLFSCYNQSSSLSNSASGSNATIVDEPAVSHPTRPSLSTGAEPADVAFGNEVRLTIFIKLYYFKIEIRCISSMYCCILWQFCSKVVLDARFYMAYVLWCRAWAKRKQGMLECCFHL